MNKLARVFMVADTVDKGIVEGDEARLAIRLAPNQNAITLIQERDVATIRPQQNPFITSLLSASNSSAFRLRCKFLTKRSNNNGKRKWNVDVTTEAYDLDAGRGALDSLVTDETTVGFGLLQFNN